MKDGRALDARHLWAITAVTGAVLWTQRGLPARPYFDVVEFSAFIGNPNLWDLSLWPALFTADYNILFCGGGFYHPLACALYMAFAQFCGADPLPFRLFQILLLWATALLMAAVGNRRLGPWSWMTALLFIAAPALANPSISYVRDQLVVFFIFLALAVKRWAPGRTQPIILSAVFLLALLSKEFSIILPALLMADDWSEGRLKSSTERGRAYVSYAALAATLLAYVVLRSRVMGSTSWSLFLGYADGEGALVIAGRAANLLGHACGLAAYPLTASAAVLLLIVLLLRGESRRTSLAGTAWLLTGLAFYSGLLPLRELSGHISHTGMEWQRLIWISAALSGLLGAAFRAGRASAAISLLTVAVLLNSRLTSRDPAVLHRSWPETLTALSFNRRHSPRRAESDIAALRLKFGADAGRLMDYFNPALNDPCRSVYIQRTFWTSAETELLPLVDAGWAYEKARRSASRGDWPGALREYGEALRLDPLHADAHLGSAAAHWKLGQTRRASEALDRHRAAQNLVPYLRNARCENPGLLSLDIHLRNQRGHGLSNERPIMQEPQPLIKKSEAADQG